MGMGKEQAYYFHELLQTKSIVPARLLLQDTQLGTC